MKKKVIIMRCSLAFILSVIVCCMSGCSDEGSEKNTSENTSIQDITTIMEKLSSERFIPRVERTLPSDMR